MDKHVYMLKNEAIWSIIYIGVFVHEVMPMKKKSIQTKILLLIVVGILLSSSIIGGLGIYSFRQELTNNVNSTMNLTCEEKSEELNVVLARMEQSVDILSVLATNYLEDISKLQDEAYFTDYVNHLSSVGISIANDTEGSVAIYMRLNPELVGPTAGFFCVRNSLTGELELNENTDLSLYDENDTEHVGWYYQPVKAGHAVWMNPYTNENIRVNMISYTMPIYKDDVLLGVVGMDVDFKYLTDMVDDIRIYETGYAFLMDENFNILHSKEFSQGTNITEFCEILQNTDISELRDSDIPYDCVIDGEKHKVVFRILDNGKIMAVIAPRDEINASSNQLILRIVLIAAAIVAVFILVTIYIIRTIIRPLGELNDAAKRIALGELDTPVNIDSEDEIGDLAKSLNQTAKQLKVKIDYINSLAYSDKLTGNKNNTAYMRDIAELKKELTEKPFDYSVFIIDVNDLKKINDNYGHELGNELIIQASQLITTVFDHEIVYRIGGDEFAVILRDANEELCKKYIQLFKQAMDTQTGYVWAGVAIGSATYHPDTDDTYETIFNRADEQMYNDKIRMKAQDKTSYVLDYII